MFGGAAAALAGLIFVAVSLNDEAALRARALPALALKTPSILIGIVVMCGAGLIPGQDRIALSLELLVVGLALTGISILAGAGGGLYWLAFGFAAGTVAATYHAPILLIVIRRG